MIVERVGVIGGGLMGSGIAEVCARTGHHVMVHEIHTEAATAARDRIESSLARAVERGKLEDGERRHTWAGSSSRRTLPIRLIASW